MSAVTPLNPPPTRRLELSDEELSALHFVVSIAQIAQENEIRRSEDNVSKFTLAAATNPDAHNTQMLQAWQGHLQRDREKLARIEKVVPLLYRTTLVLSRKRR